MASQFTERLLRITDDADLHINVETIVAAYKWQVNGRHTATQIKNFLNLTGADATGYDILATKIESGGANLPTKMARIEDIRSILVAQEFETIPAIYDTPDKVETALLSIDSYPS